MTDSRLFQTTPATLDRVDISLQFASTPTGLVMTLHAEGRCTRKRKALWVHDEIAPVSAGDMIASDVINHLGLVCCQDRPSSQQKLARGLMGPSWYDVELPFE